VCQPKSREPVSQQTGAAGNEDGRWAGEPEFLQSPLEYKAIAL
jgi:hypothetical protein